MKPDPGLLAGSRICLGCGFALGMLLLIGGCRSFQSPATMPEHLMAPRMTKVQSLNLAEFAGPTSRNEAIFPGDTLSVLVTTGAEQRPVAPWNLRVEEDGAVEVPLVGKVPVAGADIHGAETAIRTASIERGIYRHPSVGVAVVKRRSHRVTISGAVLKPGTYEIPQANCDLYAAIMVAGGLAKDADTIVEVRHPQGAGAQFAAGSRNRGVTPGGAGFGVATASHSGSENRSDWPLPLDPANRNSAAGLDPASGAAGGTDTQAATQTESQVALINLAKVAAGEDRNQHLLADGVVVNVMRQEPRIVHVMGLVRRPNQFELSQNEDVHVLDAIALAGGLETSLADKVYVVRNDPSNGRAAVIKVSLNKAKRDPQHNVLLAAGDVVSVEETPLTFLTTTLRRFVNLGINGGFAVPL